MSFWDDDTQYFIDDFTDSVIIFANTSEADTITAIFDEAQEVQSLQTGEFVNVEPMITCRSTDITGVSPRDQVTINSVDYYILEVLDDGTGITRLTLSED